MSNHNLPWLALVVAMAQPLTCLAGPPDARAKDKVSLSNLSLEVEALQTMHRFQMTTRQLEMLSRLVSETAGKPKPREDGKGSAKLQRTLTDLRDALLRNEDDRIERLEEQLEGLLDAEDPDLDDEVELTAGARRRASEVLQSLSTRQVASFLGTLSEPPDPLERLLGALDVVGKLKDEQWKTLTEDIADDLAWQLGGVDANRGRAVADSVRQFLGSARALNEKEFKKQRPELEKATRQFVGQVPPTAILHNVAEHELAELLSNPRLGALLEARLKK
jgi:hypothetical protein